MIEMVAGLNPVMQEHIWHAKAHEIQYIYLGKSNSKLLIQFLANELRSLIIKKVKHSKYFSVTLDSILDASHEEEMPPIKRCVDNSTNLLIVEEYWLEFFKVDDTWGLGLAIKLQKVLIKLDLSIKDIRGQEYDSESNISGKHKGIQRRLLEMNSRASCTPCDSHSLNLALCDIVNCCPKVVSFFGVIKWIYTLFFSFTKRWNFFKNNV